MIGAPKKLELKADGAQKICCLDSNLSLREDDAQSKMELRVIGALSDLELRGNELRKDVP